LHLPDTDPSGTGVAHTCHGRKCRGVQVSTLKATGDRSQPSRRLIVSIRVRKIRSTPKSNRDDDNPTEQTHHEQTDDCALIEFRPLQLLSYGQAVASVTAIRVIASMR
jgi:hypothetical protein